VKEEHEITFSQYKSHHTKLNYLQNEYYSILQQTLHTNSIYTHIDIYTINKYSQQMFIYTSSAEPTAADPQIATPGRPCKIVKMCFKKIVKFRRRVEAKIRNPEEGSKQKL